MVQTSSLDVLTSRRPEWRPWLTVVEEVLRRVDAPEWMAACPERPANPDGDPLIGNAAITVSDRTVGTLLDRVFEAAARSGAPKMSELGPRFRRRLDPGALLRASAVQDSHEVARLAAGHAVDAEALQAVVALVAIPLLQACRARWTASLSPGWAEPYCPVCASWPAFAEVRGIERTRYLRCGRCGAQWHGQVLHCCYCRNSDHELMTSLVPEQTGVPGVIEACVRCRGYVKVFTKLQATPPVAVLLEDLGSVALDIAAIGHGYERPPGAAREVNITVTAKPEARRLFVWNA